MRNNPEKRISLESFIQGLDLSLSFLEFVSTAIKSLREHLTTLRDFKAAVRAGATPLSWEEMCLHISAQDQRLADCLDRCTVKAATLGKVWLQVSKSQDWAYLSFAREDLKRILSETYGVKFRVRLQLTNSAAEDVLEAYRGE